MVRLSQKAQVTLFGICVAGLIFGGAGYAQAKSVEAKYEEQSKQIELYKDELNDMQGQLQEYTKYKAMYECIAVEKDQLQKEVEELQK
jgi:ribulose kinase